MNPQRGEIYRLKPSGKNRPIVIISRDVLNAGHSVLAVPFYSQQLTKRKSQQWCAFFQAGEGGLPLDCVAKADEVSLIDKLEIDIAGGAVGRFDAAQMDRLLAAVKWAIQLV